MLSAAAIFSTGAGSLVPSIVSTLVPLLVAVASCVVPYLCTTTEAVSTIRSLSAVHRTSAVVDDSNDDYDIDDGRGATAPAPAAVAGTLISSHGCRCHRRQRQRRQRRRRRRRCLSEQKKKGKDRERNKKSATNIGSVEEPMQMKNRARITAVANTALTSTASIIALAYCLPHHPHRRRRRANHKQQFDHMNRHHTYNYCRTATLSRKAPNATSLHVLPNPCAATAAALYHH